MKSPYIRLILEKNTETRALPGTIVWISEIFSKRCLLFYTRFYIHEFKSCF